MAVAATNMLLDYKDTPELHTSKAFGFTSRSAWNVNLPKDLIVDTGVAATESTRKRIRL